MILKKVSRSIFFQSKKITGKLQDVKLKMEKVGKIFDGVQSTEDYSSISR